MSKLTIEETALKVGEFHDAFGIGNADHPTDKLSTEEIALRFRLMDEENKEYKQAALDNDLVEIADALGDQLYILMGTIMKHGMQHIITDVFNEIHSSNMSKLGEDGKPILREDGKVLKGKNYFKPNLKAILDHHAKETSQTI